MWCSNCGKDYGTGAVCPDCGREGTEMPTLEWGKSQLPGELMEKWPKDEKGQPEKAVYLVHRSFLGMEDEMTVNLLQAYDIPVIRRYPNDGDFARLILGVSGNGTDIYVPESMKEEALLLIEGEIS